MGSKESKQQSCFQDSYFVGHQYSSPYFAPNIDHSRRSAVREKYSRIGDLYKSLDEVSQALPDAGLESSNLIVGIDFTKSNEWTGARSFQRKSLHHLGPSPNPYEQALSIIGRTLSPFDEDNLIPCYGFGDATTNDQNVFSFHPDDIPCRGFEEVLSRYREIVPHVQLAGPTSFAPLIETAVGIVDSSGGQYHVLVIIADGQVTRSTETGPDQLSPQEHDTVNAIVKASGYPLSIVLVGVGDGPWDMIHRFDDNVPDRAFDNFQFVNFTEIMLRHIPVSRKAAEFALNALMEIPSQHNATIDLHLLGSQRGAPKRYVLPPPFGSITVNSYPEIGWPRTNEQRTGLHCVLSAQSGNCTLCVGSNKSDLEFGCGHQTCYDCGKDLILCFTCKSYIMMKTRITSTE